MTPEERLARYRGLRGVVLHVLPQVRSKMARLYPRSATPTLMVPFGGKKGRCLWCHDPARSKAHSWHPDCVLYYVSASGKRQTMGGKWVCPPSPCGLCGHVGGGVPRFHAAGQETNGARRFDWDYVGGMELDHRVAIGVAARTGSREHARAFLPDNLWWLCSDCHRDKTKADKARMAALDRPGLHEGRQGGLL